MKKELSDNKVTPTVPPKNRVRIICNGIFLAFTVGLVGYVSIGSLIEEDIWTSFQEARDLAQKPALTKESLLSGKFFADYETYCLDQIIGRDFIIGVNATISDLKGKIKYNGTVIGEDDEFLSYYTEMYPQDYEFVSEFGRPRVDAILELKKAVDEYDGEIFYLGIPHKVEVLADKYPSYYESRKSYNELANKSIYEILDEEGIFYVDTEAAMEEHKDEYLYYKTDHHFTCKGAYYAYQELLKEMNEEYGTDFSYPEWDDLSYEIFPQTFAGGYLRKFGNLSDNRGDYFEYAIPEDMPEFTRYEDGEESDWGLIREPATEYVDYACVMYGNRANTIIDTHRDELPSIMYIGHSFTNFIELFSVYNFNEMHSIDPRHYDGNLYEYIQEHQPDYVVVVRPDLYEGHSGNISTIGEVIE